MLEARRVRSVSCTPCGGLCLDTVTMKQRPQQRTGRGRLLWCAVPSYDLVPEMVEIGAAQPFDQCLSQLRLQRVKRFTIVKRINHFRRSRFAFQCRSEHILGERCRAGLAPFDQPAPEPLGAIEASADDRMSGRKF